MLSQPYAQKYLTETILAFKNTLDWMGGDSDLIAASAKLLGETNLTYSDIQKPKDDATDDEARRRSRTRSTRPSARRCSERVQWTLTLLARALFAAVRHLPLAPAREPRAPTSPSTETTAMKTEQKIYAALGHPRGRRRRALPDQARPRRRSSPAHSVTAASADLPTHRASPRTTSRRSPSSRSQPNKDDKTKTERSPSRRRATAGRSRRR